MEPHAPRDATEQRGGCVRLRRVLVLYWYPDGLDMRLAVRQHLHALDRVGDEIVYHNAIDSPPRWLSWLRPDFCVLHTTFLGVRWNDDFDVYRRRFEWVARMRCPKIALPQDEYDHSEVLEEWLTELGATAVYSCFGGRERALLYPRLSDRVPFRQALTGYIDTASARDLEARLSPHSERPFDLVYRAAQLQYWFGGHGQLKHRIAGIVGGRAAELGLRTNVSTRWEDTIFGDAWLDFVMSGRATIGCESGSSVLDPQGRIQARIRQLLAEDPDLTFEQVDALMPVGWDAYAFFAISPRHLEAVITKTAQLLVEGEYSGVLRPELHYVPLRRDMSNVDAALGRLDDESALVEMTERAYDDLYRSGAYTIDAFAQDLRRVGGRRRANRVRLPIRWLAATPSLSNVEVARSAAVGTFPRVRLPISRSRRRIGTAASLAWALADSLATQPRLRRLFVAALKERRPVPPRKLVGDTIRLGVLHRLRHERAGNVHWWISVASSDGDVLLRTMQGEPDPERTRLAGAVRRIVWDHAGIATAVPLFPARPERGSIVLGPDGRYEFATLSILAEDHQDEIVELLASVIQ